MPLKTKLASLPRCLSTAVVCSSFVCRSLCVDKNCTNKVLGTFLSTVGKVLTTKFTNMEKTFRLLVLVTVVAGSRAEVADKYYEDLAAQQTVKFAEKTGRPIGILTTANGAPVEYREANMSLNRRLILNEFLMETLTHLNRQRIPERVVHANGAGASGYFEVTNDVTDICKAKFLSQINKKTPVAVRFSTVVPNMGGSDTTRDGRGFAVKFYTEDGNFDLVGLSTPVFPIKDPLLFPTFANAQGRNPATFLNDNNMFWDFFTLRPESFHFLMYRFGDEGIPDGYRHMPGFSIHTYQLVNENGNYSFVRFHLVSNQGLKYLTSAEATRIGGLDPDYAIRDLYNAIANGDYPSWQLYFQVLSFEDVKRADFDVFDTTRLLPLDKYPLRPVGQLVLNKNPVNNFAEVEQIALCPNHLVPGILGAPDQLFQSRRLSYRDAQLYRLGANFQNIPINCPFRSFTYNINGLFNLEKTDDSPTYYPNTYHGPVPYVDINNGDLIEIVQDSSLSFDQAANHYENLSEDARERLIGNFVDSLRKASTNLQERALKWFREIHEELAERVEHGLLYNKNKQQRAVDHGWGYR